ncbi:MAG: intradiol ring-cleavage dioxygenase [Rhodocyclaceae bacterium]|nr:intradiol ring-cleavage dioxygenase [Rhodocyclaceae bacterium]MBX3667520.1 intradiol ring-cleavage dioxygenase [Rhodocyclaceae bacterium]
MKTFSATTALAAWIAACSALPCFALDPTPGQVRGPFYPNSALDERDANLAQVAGRAALGTPLTVRGRVLTRGGAPVAGAQVELWQADAQGRYHHPADDSPATPDPGFQGWGETVTGPQGHYEFRTILPVPYSGRAPHLHFLVRAAGRPEFVTQMYVAGNAENEGDFLYSRLSAAERARLTVRPNKGIASFDIVLP